MRPVVRLVLSLLLAASARGDLSDPQPAGADAAAERAEAASGDDWAPPDSLQAATAGLIEELTRHGLSGASPFALLLNPEAELWGAAHARGPVVTVPLAQAESEARAVASAAWQSPALRKVREAFAPCAAPDADLPTCVRESVLSMLDRAARSKELRLLGGAITVSAANDDAAAPEGAEAAADRPEDARSRGDRLDEAIARKVADLAASRVLTLRLPPQAIESVRSGMEEFRGKKGKGLLPLLVMMGIMMKGMTSALAMGTVAMIAGKALMVGLISLTISAVLGLKKLASNGGGYEVVNVSAGPHHHARHLPPLPPHLDPYRAHAPDGAAEGAST